MRNLELCMHGRLIEAKRKTHSPTGRALARLVENADALRQRMNRAMLAKWRVDVRPRLRKMAVSLIPKPVAWIIDDTGIQKKGTKSPGVAHQYCGSVGKLCNSQCIVSTHLSGWTSSVPLEMELYLPKNWVNSPARLKEAGIPKPDAYRTKLQMALDQIRQLLKEHVPQGVVLGDQGYGKATWFRQALDKLECQYALGIPDSLLLWRKGEGPAVPKRSKKKGRKPSRPRIGEQEPVTAASIAEGLKDGDFKLISLGTGRHHQKTVRYAFMRVRTAHKALQGIPPGKEEWLIIEWPKDQDAPSHYYLSNIPKSYPYAYLAEVAKLRWRVERDYQDMKQEVGLSHYEGRTWRGFNNHLTITMAAFYFLVSQREFSPL